MDGYDILVLVLAIAFMIVAFFLPPAAGWVGGRIKGFFSTLLNR